MGKYKSPRNDGTPSNRKVRGFGFYIQSNEKLKRKDRLNLIERSEEEFGLIEQGLRKLGWTTDQFINKGVCGELDPNNTDIELMDLWNKHYDEYGYMMSEEFSSKWYKEREGQVQNPQKSNSQSFEDLLERIQSLEKRLTILEGKSPVKKKSDKEIDF